jgi:hypothetical protein
MRTVRARLAGDTAIDAGFALAGKSGDAIVGVVTARIGTQTASDAQVALVGRIAAVSFVLASATTGDKTTREVVAARRKTDLTHCARIGCVAQCVRVWTRRAERARGAPRAIESAAATRAANSTGAEVSSHAPDAAGSALAPIDAAVQIDASAAFRTGRKRGGSRFTTTGHSCSSQQNVSKETHCRSGSPREAGLSAVRWPVLSRKHSALGSRSHPGPTGA